MTGGMVLSKPTTKKVDQLVRIFKDVTGFTLTRSQVIERLVDGELSLHEHGLKTTKSVTAPKEGVSA